MNISSKGVAVLYILHAKYSAFYPFYIYNLHTQLTIPEDYIHCSQTIYFAQYHPPAKMDPPLKNSSYIPSKSLMINEKVHF